MAGTSSVAAEPARLPISQVVSESLRERLDEVVHRLEPAAERWQETPRHLHQLRVSIRRAVAALDLFRPLLPPRRTRRLRRKLQRLRRLSDLARDCDVLLVRLANELPADDAFGLIARVQRERNAAQQPVLEAYQRLAVTGRLERRAQELSDRVSWRRYGGKCNEPTFRWFARRRLRPLVRRFFRAGRADLSRVDAVHQFRIRGKQLRYSLELLRPALPAKALARLYRQVKRLQDKLGAITDHAAAVKSLRRWSDALRDSRQAAALQDLLAKEEPRLAAAHEAFDHWWTPKRARRLRKKFRLLLA